MQPEADEAERDAVTATMPRISFAWAYAGPRGQSATPRSRIMGRRMIIDPAHIAAQPAALLLGADTAMQAPGRTGVDDMETVSRPAAVLVPIAVAPARTVLPVKVPDPLAEAL